RRHTRSYGDWSSDVCSSDLHGGGQVEIVGEEERLLYHSDADAARKIAETLGDPQRQQDLLEHLAGRREQFSTEHFIDRIRSIVRSEERRVGEEGGSVVGAEG